MIEFKNVTKIYSNGTYGLNNVSLQIEQGEFVFIVGASGAGKSTLLKLIMHEEDPSSGEIIVGDQLVNKLTRKQIPFFRRKMGIVFQDFRLIDKMTVFDNVAFAMRVIGAEPKEVTKRVNYILDLVGLSKKAKNRPSEISGGEQQRVSLARALVNNPQIIIADEPTGNVDPQMSYDIMELLTKINKTGTTVVVVTHEKSLVKQFDKRVIRMKKSRVISDSAHPEIAEKRAKEKAEKEKVVKEETNEDGKELPENTSIKEKPQSENTVDNILKDIIDKDVADVVDAEVQKTNTLAEDNSTYVESDKSDNKEKSEIEEISPQEQAEVNKQDNIEIAPRHSDNGLDLTKYDDLINEITAGK